MLFKKIGFLVFLLPIVLFGMNPFFNGLNSGAPLTFVNNPVGVYSFVQNPALLDNQTQDFSFSYNVLYQEMGAMSIMAKIYNNKLFSLASGFQYIHYGAFSDNIQHYNMSARQFVVGANFFLIPYFNFGVNLKYENELFLDSYNNAFSIDVGLFKSMKIKSSQIFLGLTMFNPVLISSTVLVSPDVHLAFGLERKFLNHDYSLNNQIISCNNFTQNSDVVNLSFFLYKSIKLKISNKFDSFSLFNPAFGLQYSTKTLKNNIVINYAIQNVTSNLFQNSLNLYIKIN